MIRLLLVDDQAIMREGLRVLLTLEPDFDVIGEAENGQQALAEVELLKPNVVLMDLRMPIMDGIAATQKITQQFPQTKVVVLTTFDEDELVAKALRVGAMGYALKDTPSEDLAEIIRAVYKGYSQFAPGIVQKAMAQVPSSTPLPPVDLPLGFHGLTPREKEILRLLGTGASNREIAQDLYITEGTVRNHVTNILSRLQLRDRTQAALFCPYCYVTVVRLKVSFVILLVWRSVQCCCIE